MFRATIPILGLIIGVIAIGLFKIMLFENSYAIDTRKQNCLEHNETFYKVTERTLVGAHSYKCLNSPPQNNKWQIHSEIP